MTAPRKKKVDSRAKGKRGELEVAKVLTELGYPARRGQQFRGGADSPDVICPSLSVWHIEVKRTADCKMFSPATVAAWMEQAKRDRGEDQMPVVFHRWNGARIWWVFVIPYGQLPYWQRLDYWLREQAWLPGRWGWSK